MNIEKVLHFVDLDAKIPMLHCEGYEEYAKIWLESNTTGWYKIMIDISGAPGGSGLDRIFRISVAFEKAEDAVHFKMVWT